MNHRPSFSSAPSAVVTHLLRNTARSLFRGSAYAKIAHSRFAGSQDSRGELRAHGVGPHEPPAVIEPPAVPADPIAPDPPLPAQPAAPDSPSLPA